MIVDHNIYEPLLIISDDPPFRGYIIVELRTPAMPVGVGGGKERGGFHLN